MHKHAPNNFTIRLVQFSKLIQSVSHLYFLFYEQLEEFHKIYITKKTASPANSVLLYDNFRPVQQLNGRTVLSSFKMTSFPTPTAGANGLYPRWTLAAFIVAVVIVLNYF